MEQQSFYYKLVRFSQRYAKVIIVVAVLITLLFGYAALSIKLNADYDALLPDDNITNQHFSQYYTDEEATGSIILTYRSDQMYRPEVLELLQSVVTQIEAFDNISTGTHPFSMVTAEDRGGRIIVVPINSNPDGDSWTNEEARIFKERLLQDVVAQNLIVSEDGTMMMLIFPVSELRDDNTEQVASIKEIIEPLEEFGVARLNGTMPITSRVEFLLVRDLATLLGFSFLVIMLVYYFSFRAKRAVFLPLSVVLMGVIWSLGIMSLLGFKLTIFNIVTPPLVLTLGSSYSIHMLNEYYRASVEHSGGDTDDAWIVEAVVHISKTIVLACVTTVAGFLSLLVTQLSQFREFGLSTAIGITVCAVLTLFYLPALLHQLPTPKEVHKRQVSEGGLTKIISSISEHVMRHWPVILVAFGLIIVAFIIAFPLVSFETNYSRYFAKDDPMLISSKAFNRTIGGAETMYVTLDAPSESKDYFLDPEVLKDVHAFETSVMKQNEDITHLLSFPRYVSYLHGVSQGEERIPETRGLVMLMSRFLRLVEQMDGNNAEMEMLVNDDHSRLIIAYHYRDAETMGPPGLANAQGILATIEEKRNMLPEEVTVTPWGNGRRFIALSELIESDQRVSTLFSTLVVFLITAITFKSLGFGLFSIIPIAVGIMANYVFMVLFQIPFDMITMGFSSVTVGVGIDDAIHFIIRFKEVRRSDPGEDLKAVMRKTIRLTGRPIALTSISIIAGLLVLSFASFMPVRYFGILISIALLNTLLATLFILPACMYAGLTAHERIRKARGGQLRP
ncbi:MAG: efflux RND transporter permease subunit [Spirochaetota bacterium]